MADSKVRCYDEDGEKVIGMVPYTDNLDRWNGSNWQSGGAGRHLGVGKTKDGRFYLCFGTQWQGERDYAVIVAEEEAKSAIMEHNPDAWAEIFDEPITEL